jgi:hypothetical protein
MKTSLPFYDFSCIFHAQNRSSSMTDIFMISVILRCFVLILIFDFIMKVCVSQSELWNLHLPITFIIKSLCNRLFWFTTNVSIRCLKRICFLLLIWRHRRFSDLKNFTFFFIRNTLTLIYINTRTINILFRYNLECFDLFILFNWRRSLCLNWSLCKSKRLRFYQRNNLTPGQFHFLRRICLSSFLFFPCCLFFSLRSLLERRIHKLNFLADLNWSMSKPCNS